MSVVRPVAEPAPPAYTRLTVLAPRTRVDVALPADVPVGELVPMVLELVGEPGPGRRLLPWRLTGVTGGPLHPAATLDELGVLDGELLRLGPDGAPPPPPVFDDPVDALAASAGDAQRPLPDARPAVAVVLACLAAALLATVPAGPWGVAAAVLGGLGAVAALARTARTDRGALVAVALAAGAGAAASGPGAAQVLLGVTAAGVVAAVAQALRRAVDPVLVGIVVVAVPTALAALLHLRLGASPAALAAGTGALALLAGPLLPRAALRLAALPAPVVPTDAGELAADDGPLPPAELAERAALARAHLAGLVGGCGVLAAASVGPAAAAGSGAGTALAAVVVAVLGLRARGFADAAPARSLLGCAVAGGAALAVAVALGSDGPGRLLVAGLVMAAVAVVAGPERPPASPVARRAVDVLEGVLVASAVPLALAATGLFALVRAL
ncbi:type VII secretion integral membrane protein EccD [Pseudonocardia broussonetiae]|uniref:Type VII secretion integral membrane protein EccD n=1 Tax=Pseudonocardia broussonetiae TaxID=2736640 RepID=A0A6M6JEZ9_9PSEU|nr:type VII secretion integral membrane protein EccD [Pseudonocardia broussonetiae]QJY46504.1 type VII secretion integral membrane protein EccD [Pseudonocardia broussonetiae]